MKKICLFMWFTCCMYTAVLAKQSDSRLPDTTWVYKQVDGKELQMFVFLPDDYYRLKKEFPVMVFFHGGSWVEGEASWQFPDCAYWSRRGMIAISVDYRLKERDHVEVPLECLKDAKSAIRFVRKNAVMLKADTQKIVVGGDSAGGQLAAALATIMAKETNDSSDDLSISCRPDAVILTNPYFKCVSYLSPPGYIVGGLPPFITFLGDDDVAITVDEMKAFSSALKKAGNYAELYIGKGGKHGFCNGRDSSNPYFYWSAELEDNFLVKQGILTGPSLVKIPAGVVALTRSQYDVY